MENPFFTSYFEFVREIKKCNFITAVINSEYKGKDVEGLISTQNAFDNSVHNLLNFIQGINSLPSEEANTLSKLIKDVNKKANLIDKNKLVTSDTLFHYYSMLNSTNISFIVVFKNGDVWNVNFTSSLRSDRMETHSNRFAQTKATKNYLVVCSYPYQDESSIKCINTTKQNNTYYGSCINVVCLEEFMDELLFNIFRYKADKNTGALINVNPKDVLSIVNGGRGVEIERMYAAVLNNKENFDLHIKTTDGAKKEQTIGSFLPNHYSLIVNKILSDLEINIEQVTSISAEHVGGKSEKADVIIFIELTNHDTIRKGISLKSSSMDYVAVHEKHAIDFIDFLGITTEKLKEAFIEFEKKHSFSKMRRELVDELSNYYENEINKKALVEWAIIGDPNSQYKADYVLLHSYSYNSKEALGYGLKLYSCKEYIDEIFNSDIDGAFGTHLSWTYKGNIQLKAPFIFQ